ncbi:MAG: M20/M25/M40 family metallo-hydrolase [Clostridia bacterium]|nr:M20/M25/M40 family metallo-hydrolase [Clostridia bacterium]
MKNTHSFLALTTAILSLLTVALPAFAANRDGILAATPGDAASYEPVEGDADGDGKVTPGDAIPYEPVEGDADGDGKVTPADARLVLRYTVKLEEIAPLYLANCDADGNGSVTPGDARLILRWSVGLFVDEPVTERQTEPPETTTQAPPETTAVPAKPTKADYVRQLIGRVKDAELLENMQIFTEEIGSRWYTFTNFTTAKNRIKKILRYNGFADSAIWEDGFTCNGVQAYNVYTKITTKVKDPDIILFVAHYDSYHEGRGSVDNASGLCTVLEISRVLKSMKTDFGVEVRFLFTACEELGYYGAYRYVNHYSPLSLDRHVAVFNVDMSAHFKNGEHHFLTVSTKSAYGANAPANKPSRAVDEAKKIFGSCGEYQYISPVAAGLHDLIPFDGKGVPTITLSWRVVNASHSYGSDYNLAAPSQIHTYKDVLANTDMNSLYKTTRLAVGAAAVLVYDYVK